MVRKIDLTGRRIGKLTVLRESDQRKGYWFCQCECGRTKEIFGSCLRKERTLSCGCLRASKNPIHIGDVFGSLTVIEQVEEYEPDLKKRESWLCRCECGTVKAYRGDTLKSGGTKSCGCKQFIRKHKPIEVGDKFGSLTVLEMDRKRDPDGHIRTYWRCQCECGNQTLVRDHNLKTGTVIGCGCRMGGVPDLAGQRFGDLEVLERYVKEEYRAKGSYWTCKCHRCGKTCVKNAKDIVRSLTCGCLQEVCQQTMEQMNQIRIETKTNPFRIRHCDKLQKNNKTGVTGVCFDKSRGYYVAYITFQGVKYKLKFSRDINVCIAARKEAEEALFGNFLEWYDAVYGEFKSVAALEKEKRTNQNMEDNKNG